MCRVMEEMRNETDRARLVKIARHMLSMGKYTYDEIAAVLEISIEEVKALDEGGPA